MKNWCDGYIFSGYQHTEAQSKYIDMTVQNISPQVIHLSKKEIQEKYGDMVILYIIMKYNIIFYMFNFVPTIFSLIGIVIIVFIIFILLFLIIRYFVLWYWKIRTIIITIEKNIESIENLNRNFTIFSEYIIKEVKERKSKEVDEASTKTLKE